MFPKFCISRSLWEISRYLFISYFHNLNLYSQRISFASRHLLPAVGSSTDIILSFAFSFRLIVFFLLSCCCYWCCSLFFPVSRSLSLSLSLVHPTHTYACTQCAPLLVDTGFFYCLRHPRVWPARPLPSAIGFFVLNWFSFLFFSCLLFYVCAWHEKLNSSK